MGFLLAAMLLVIFLGNPVPASTDTMIDSVRREGIPELFSGETGFANNHGVKIFYEVQRPIHNRPSRGSIVLFMGAGGTATFWPEFVIKALLAKGYEVIRFDYRGTGLSDWILDWTKDNAYTLDDMAADVLAILDRLEIKRAHLVGVSMGGAVARQFVLDYPQRTASLSLIVSPGRFDRMSEPVPGFSDLLTMLRLLLRYGLWPEERSRVKFVLGAMHVMNQGSRYPVNDKQIIQQALYEIQRRRGFHAQALQQHFYAIKLSMQQTGQTDVLAGRPVLFILGENDRLIPAGAMARRIQSEPQHVLRILDGVAHILPQARIDDVVTWLDNFIVSQSTDPA